MRLERQASLYLQTASTVEAELKLTGINFLSFAEVFRDLVGAKPYAEIIAQRDDDFAHEGPVYLPSSNEVRNSPHSGHLFPDRIGDPRQAYCHNLQLKNSVPKIAAT